MAKEINDWEDVPSAPIDDWEDVEEVGQLESGARGLAQGASLGFSDEATGGVEALWEKLKGNPETIEALYQKSRDESRAANKAAQEANPITFGAGQVGGAIGTGLLTGGSSVGGMAAVGAAQGLGSSEADLTQGDVGGALRDTAIGGTIGAVAGGASKALGSLASKSVPKVTNVLEELATNPALDKVSKLGVTDMSKSLINNPMAQKVLGGVPIVKDLVNSKAGQLAGEVSGRMAAYSNPISGTVQGIADSARVLQKGSQITLEKLIPNMGKFSKPLQDAAARGSQSLAATDFILAQNNPEYREQKKKLQEEGNSDTL